MRNNKFIINITKLILVAFIPLILSGCTVCHLGLGTPLNSHNNMSGQYIVELQNANQFRVHYDGDDWPRGPGDLTSISMSMITGSEQDMVYRSVGVIDMTNQTTPDNDWDSELDAYDGDKIQVDWGSLEPFYVRANRGEMITITVNTIENDPRGACEAGWTNFSFTVPDRDLDLPETCEQENTYSLYEAQPLSMIIAGWPLLSSREVVVNTSGKNAGPELIPTADPVICLRSVP